MRPIKSDVGVDLAAAVVQVGTLVSRTRCPERASGGQVQDEVDAPARRVWSGAVDQTRTLVASVLALYRACTWAGYL